VEIDAIVCSVDDPQLTRCLEAVRGQTVPFTKVIHQNNVCPYPMAVNKGIAQSSGDWLMLVDGDMILDKTAVERILQYMKDNLGENILGYYVALYDTFLNCPIGYFPTLRGELYRKLTFANSMTHDSRMVNALRKKRWRTVKTMEIRVGTHFDSPDEFQVFKRFYVHGIRYPCGYPRRNIIRKLESGGTALHQVGIEAIRFADKKKVYPGGRNIEFDKENYQEWLRFRS
jgi:glycosyltransferase involved in cell wall biosynthesis